MTTQHNLELAVGRVLWLGIMASTVCLTAGLLMTLAGETGVVAGRLLTVGLIVLLATPAARVVVSVVDYTLDRDWPFALLTTVVLLELILSVLAAIYGFQL